MKKILLGIPALAVAFVFTSAVASAGNHDWTRHWNKDETTVSNENNAYIKQNVISTSNTGFNFVSGRQSLSEIISGDATSEAYGEVVANMTDNKVNSGSDDLEVTNLNRAKIDQSVFSDSNTGYNQVQNEEENNTFNGCTRHSRCHHHPVTNTQQTIGKIKSGNAYSNSMAVIQVNSTVSEVD